RSSVARLSRTERIESAAERELDPMRAGAELVHDLVQRLLQQVELELVRELFRGVGQEAGTGHRAEVGREKCRARPALVERGPGHQSRAVLRAHLAPGELSAECSVRGVV